MPTHTGATDRAAKEQASLSEREIFATLGGVSHDAAPLFAEGGGFESPGASGRVKGIFSTPHRHNLLDYGVFSPADLILKSG